MRTLKKRIRDECPRCGGHNLIIRLKTANCKDCKARFSPLLNDTKPPPKEAKDYWRHMPCYVLVFKGHQATVIPCDDVHDAKVVRQQLGGKCWIVGRFIEIGEAEKDAN